VAGRDASAGAYHFVVVIVVERGIAGVPVKDGVGAVLLRALQSILANVGMIAVNIGSHI
jgi:hypothetical protein